MKGDRKPLTWKMDGNCIRCTSHSLSSVGYPQRRDKPNTFARLILFRRYGKQPSYIVARHTCDNRWCIKPDHIIPGTHTDNSQDAIRAGVLPFGEKIAQSKLKTEQVATIRLMLACGVPQKSIAGKFGVSPSLISKIHTRVIWSRI